MEIENNVHFTYKKEVDFNALCQGDVLDITPEIKEVLEKYHPYFNNNQYKYFIVLTQSCDLVRRSGNKCKSPYITLAAVRDFDDFFNKTVTENCNIEKVNDLLLINTDNYHKAIMFIERIFNNTESDYFFLYKDESLNFPKSMVAYLKVSIAIKSDEHYDKCLKAKKLELSDEFKAKIGWLVGNIYSRVGTKDWSEILSQKEKEEKIKNIIKEKCVVASKEKILKLKEQIISKGIENCDDANVFLESINIKTKYDEVVDTIESEINKIESINNNDKKIVLQAIKNSTYFRAAINKKD